VARGLRTAMLLHASPLYRENMERRIRVPHGGTSSTALSPSRTDL
jgi:hypothetical protein